MKTFKSIPRKSIFFLILLTLVFNLGACSLADTSLTARLSKFYNFVNDEQIITDFKQGNLKKVQFAISNQLYTPNTPPPTDTTKTNTADLTPSPSPKQKQFTLLRQEEWIDFFSIEQTVNYYYYTFYLPTQKKKKKKK